MIRDGDALRNICMRKFDGPSWRCVRGLSKIGVLLVMNFVVAKDSLSTRQGSSEEHPIHQYSKRIDLRMPGKLVF